MVENKRNSGVDLLKCLLAIMVLTLHYNSSLGQVQINVNDLSLNWYFIWLTGTISYGAVNVYVIITGYYEYKSNKSFDGIIRKLGKLWTVVIFYSVAEYFVISVIFHRAISIRLIINRFMPITSGQWWFFSLYFLILLFSPVLNLGIKNINISNLVKIEGVMLIILCIIPQILLWKDGFGIENGYSFIWFVFLYYTGALLSKIENDDNSKKSKEYIFINKHRILIYFLSIAILYGSKVAIANVSKIMWGEVKYSGVLFSYNSIFVFVAAVSMFMIFENIKLKNTVIKKITKIISPLALASYLFHCQIDFRDYVWPALKCYDYSNKSILPFTYLLTIISIFLIAVIIEKARAIVWKIAIKTIKN